MTVKTKKMRMSGDRRSSSVRSTSISSDVTADDLNNSTDSHEKKPRKKHTGAVPLQVYGRPSNEPLSPTSSDPNCNLQYDEYEIAPDRILTFSDPDHFCGFLHMMDFKLGEITYKSIEHCYQASKLFELCGPTWSGRISIVRTSKFAKKTAHKILEERSVRPEAVDKWKRTQGISVLIRAIRAKFEQHKELAQQLLDTGDKILIHAFEGDDYWFSNMTADELMKWAKVHKGEVLKIPQELVVEHIDQVPLVGKGKNLLGAICMKVRKELAEKIEPKRKTLESIPELGTVEAALEELNKHPVVDEETKNEETTIEAEPPKSEMKDESMAADPNVEVKDELAAETNTKDADIRTLGSVEVVVEKQELH